MSDSRQSPLDEQTPCRECRRRKTRCDCRIPVCSACARYRRHCLYDKHSRTPLTRKHLTEVEDRLQRAEALLKSLLAEDDVSQIIEQGLPPSFDISPYTTIRSAGTYSPSPDIAVPQATDYFYRTQGHRPPLRENSGSNEDTSRAQIWTYSVTSPMAEVGEEDGGALEPEGVDDEFEWDEQEFVMDGMDMGDILNSTDVETEDVEKVTDGMASLAVEAANTGYLGSASGASLLRTLWMGTGDGSEADSNVRSERRKYLQLLLRKWSAQRVGPTIVQAQPFFTRAIVDSLIDSYFTLYHPNFPILHEPTFRAQYRQLLPRPRKGAWQILVNIVAALGAFVSNSAADTTDLAIFQTVKRHQSTNFLESGNLTLVQAFALAATYLQKRNKPNSGYNYGGLALRLAIGLGLHKNSARWNISPLKQENRRRTWWCLCILDVGVTITYSRPLIWPQVGVDTPLPSNIHEHDLLVTSETLPPEAQSITLYTYIRVQSDYHLQTMQIYNRLISNSFPSAEELLALDDNIIEKWIQSVPNYFRVDETLVVHNRYGLTHGINMWRFRNLRIIMYRRFLVKWAGQENTNQEGNMPWQERLAMERCITAARDTIASIQNFWNVYSHTRLAAFYVLYFLFQASLIPVHSLRSNPRSPSSPEWRSQVQATLKVLSSMTDMSPSSAKCHDVILTLCGASLDDVVGGFEQHQGDMFDDAEAVVAGLGDATAWMSGDAAGLWTGNSLDEAGDAGGALSDWDANLAYQFSCGA